MRRMHLKKYSYSMSLPPPRFYCKDSGAWMWDTTNTAWATWDEPIVSECQWNHGWTVDANDFECRCELLGGKSWMAGRHMEALFFLLLLLPLGHHCPTTPDPPEENNLKIKEQVDFPVRVGEVRGTCTTVLLYYRTLHLFAIVNLYYNLCSICGPSFTGSSFKTFKGISPPFCLRTSRTSARTA